MEPSPRSADVPQFSQAAQREVLLTLAIAALMVMYVETMIVPAIPRFITFFDGAPLSTVAWILTAYLLVGVVATPILAKMGDIYGKKRLLLGVLIVYAVAVCVAGFTPQISDAAGISRANAIYVLIFVRGIQGIGVGMFPLAFALVGEVYPPDRVAQAQGVIASMFAVGATLGLLGGAWITQTFGWQTTYHSIIPLAVAAPIVVYFVLRESRYTHRVPVDVPGSLLLGGALGAFLVGLSQGPTWGWGATAAVTFGGVPLGTPQLLVLAAILFAGFLYWEPRTANPMVDFQRLKERNIVLANIAGITAAASMFVFFVTSQTILQVPVRADGLGQTTLYAGLASVPCSLSMLVLAPLMGRAVGTQGPRPVMVMGGGLVLIGGIFFAFFHATIYEAALDAIPILVGVIAAFISMTNIVVLSSRRQETGIQTGMNQTFRNIGSAIGPVLASSILTSFTQAVVVGQHPGPAGPVAVTVNFPSLLAYQVAFLSVAALGAITLLMALGLRNYRYLADGTRVEGPPAPAVAPLPRPDAVAPSAGTVPVLR